MFRNRSSKRAVLLAIASLIGIVWLLPRSVSAGEDCVRLERWVKEHKETLPRDYEGISQYPLSSRRAIFGVLSPEEKSEVWRDHLNHFLDIHPELTADQKDVLLRALDLMSPGFYALPKQGFLWQEQFGKPLSELKERAQQVFDAESQNEIFAELGGAKPGLILSPITDSIKIDSCKCSTDSDWCDNWGRGKCKATACGVIGGCGTWYGYTCDGMCYPNTPPTT